MMEDEVAALVVDNGSGKSESTLECNKRAVVHYQSQTEIMPKKNFDFGISIFDQNFVFSVKFLGPQFWLILEFVLMNNV